MSSILFADLQPPEAVSRARELSAQGQEDAWEALDRHLRWHVIRWIQDRSGDIEKLRGAVLDSHHWAARQDREPWRQRWSYLLEILRDAEQQPGLAADLEAAGSVEGRAAELLSVLALRGKPLRPTDLVDEMGLSIQQVSNLGKKLADAGLITRRQHIGRATWFLLTPRGIRLMKLLKRTELAAASTSEAPERTSELAALWTVAKEVRVAVEMQETVAQVVKDALLERHEGTRPDRALLGMLANLTSSLEERAELLRRALDKVPDPT